MRIVCISDTHGMHRNITVPDGDVLIHAGDGTGLGQLREVVDLNRWFGELPHHRKFFVPGNHDDLFMNDYDLAKLTLTNVTLLLDKMVAFHADDKEWTIYGTPWVDTFRGWAFELPINLLSRKYDRIPKVDILVTHNPPIILDDGKGNKHLSNVVNKRKPKLHVFGHIHEGYGQSGNSVNASLCDYRYMPVNAPIVVEIK